MIAPVSIAIEWKKQGILLDINKASAVLIKSEKVNIKQ